MDGHPYEIDLIRPRTELVLIKEKLLEDKSLEEGEEYEYMSIEILNSYLALCLRRKI